MTAPIGYDHASFESRRRILRWMITNIGFRFLAKVDRFVGLENIPEHGPAILMYNHIAFADPVIIIGGLPRNVVPLAKVEVYKVPIWGIFPRLWGVIPVRREEFDRGAIRASLNVLDAGEILLMAPEGTRNPQLQHGKSGIAYLAVKSEAPVIPVAVVGSEGFPTVDRQRWSGPGAVVRIGEPFRFRLSREELEAENLARMTAEAMYRLAALLPEDKRGVYSDLSRASTAFLEMA